MSRTGWGRCLLLLGVLTLPACAHRVPFTYALKEAHSLGAEELMGLQFYVSHDLVLRRRVEHVEHEVTPEARLEVLEGQEREELHIRAGTPGVVVEAGPDWLRVKFEPGPATLKFRAVRKPPQKDPRRIASKVVEVEGDQMVVHSPSDAWEQGYKLAASEWSYGLREGFQGRMMYGDWEYVADEGGTHALLLIDTRSLSMRSEHGRTLPGMVLPGVPR
ncbi:hypothetical protein [Archangium sp.]|uniref:hypothetical protein n=1 Tax=Archangium sp. TaxID=1872627 RepID=UPI002ED7DF94